MSLTVTLTSTDRETSTNSLNFFGNLLNSEQSDLHLKCRYPTILGTAEFPAEITEMKPTDKTIGYGSFTPNFDLQFYTNDSFRKPVSGYNFGDQVFSQVVFKLSSLYNQVKFILTDCKVSNGEIDIYFIKDNCYANSLQAGLVSNSHINISRSRFSYRSFAFDSEDIFSIHRTSCKIRLCYEDESCMKSDLNSKCPNDFFYNYSHYGNPK